MNVRPSHLASRPSHLAYIVALAALTLPASLLAQAASPYAAPSLADSGKIMMVVDEAIKPGKDGLIHEKSEMLYATAMRAANSKDFYLGMNSITGAPHALFLDSYASLADYEAMRATATPALKAALDHANETDGAVLNETSSTIFVRRDDLSTNIKDSPAGTRYIELERFEIKPGHEAAFEDGVKLYRKDRLKAYPDAHWTMYSSIYGHAHGTVYIFMIAYKSLKEADASLAADTVFGATTSTADLKKLDETLSSAALSVETNLYRITPKLSYPDPAMVAADAAFWKLPTTTAKPAAKTATKPAP